jgi:murein DD-endopeptidase MepM/ murein hydrolase activator NlpD
MATLTDPFPGAKLSSGYGWRDLAGGTFHEGIDFPFRLNTVLPALESGTVTQVGETRKFGKFIVVRADNGLYYRWHAINRAAVAAGQQVTKGQTIAYSGATGAYTTGPHAHLQICRTADPSTHIDPEAVLIAPAKPAPAGTPKPAPILPKGKHMYLAWSVDGGGYLFTEKGRADVPNTQVWRLLVRLLNSTPSKPDEFNLAELDMIRAVINSAK